MTFTQPTSEGQALADMLTAHIFQAATNAPRSLQKTIGPSAMGTECISKYVRTLLDLPKVNVGDPWISTVGTAVHAWLAEAFSTDDRWLIEQKVTIRGQITGTADLYDTHTGTVIDWKTSSADNIKRYRDKGPGPEYRTQVHLYGYGYENAGRAPKNVAIAFLPRSGFLDNAYVWTEKYDRSVAEKALERYDDILALMAALDLENQPQNWALLPTAESFCFFCSYRQHNATDLAVACPGHRALTEGTAA